MTTTDSSVGPMQKSANLERTLSLFSKVYAGEDGTLLLLFANAFVLGALSESAARGD